MGAQPRKAVGMQEVGHQKTQSGDEEEKVTGQTWRSLFKFLSIRFA